LITSNSRQKARVAARHRAPSRWHRSSGAPLLHVIHFEPHLAWTCEVASSAGPDRERHPASRV